MKPRNAPRPVLSFFLVAAACLSAVLPVSAQESGDCFDCHEDHDLVGTVNDVEVSMFVDAGALAASVHSENDCIDCHTDLEGADFPHEDDLAPAQCGGCHSDTVEEHNTSLHGQAAARGDQLAPRCADCHGDHGILPSSDPKSPTAKEHIPALCVSCHQEGEKVSRKIDLSAVDVLDRFPERIHGDALLRRGIGVSPVCTTCHTAHDQLSADDPESSTNPGNASRTCTKCHSLIEDIHRNVVEARRWKEAPESLPACTDCHSPHSSQHLSPTGLATANCLQCHGKSDLQTVRDGKTVSLHVDEAAMASSIHSGIACAQCHTEVAPSQVRPCETVQSPVNCGACHADVATQYAGGIHGRLAQEGDEDAPGCLDCHDYHATKSSKEPDSPTYPRNVPILCASCHREGEKAARRIHHGGPAVVQGYEESIHGKGLTESGLIVTATCSSCHTAHAPLPPDDPNSSVHPKNVAATCGKCHHGIEEVYNNSIHAFDPAAEVKPGEHRKPTCESCHTSHNIRRTDLDDFRLSIMSQCGGCHEKESETFFDTYHGKVSRLGTGGAARCHDCHGTHDILPSDDARSHLSATNVVATCGKCHEGSHTRFTGYLTHATHEDREKYPWLFWTFWAMTGLLVGTLSVSLLHSFAWLRRLRLTRNEWQPHREAPAGPLYRRFTAQQRVMHLTMMISFFTLALTGMALKFSYMPWAQAVTRVLGGFQAMGILHRMAALVLIALVLVHIWSVRRYKIERGLSWWGVITHPDSILFNRNDLRELAQALRWFAGRAERPRFGRYTYWEKFDYFAVVWGVVVIGFTGVILWIPEVMTYVLPGWSVNVATIIHSDEALLATAFIFTVHFFNTHLRPDKFPMDPVIFTGRVPLEEMKYDKPREYEEMVERGELETYLVEPYPKQVERWLRIFGFIALSIGLVLVGLILYSVVLGHP